MEPDEETLLEKLESLHDYAAFQDDLRSGTAASLESISDSNDVLAVASEDILSRIEEIDKSSRRSERIAIATLVVAVLTFLATVGPGAVGFVAEALGA